jgi:AcrR family transcriptional regulator
MPKKLVTERSLRAIKTKKKLYQSAVGLIDKYGYDNVTIEDICKKAGVSVGAFYHYYNSKSDIIVEFFKQIDDYFGDKVEPELTGSASKCIDTFFYHYAKFHVDRGVDHTSHILKVEGDFFLDKTRYIYLKLTELVEKAKSEGLFGKKTDTERVVDFFIIIARGLLFDWTLSHGQHDLSGKMEAYINLAKRSFI